MARRGITVRTGIIEPGRLARSEPRRCHIVVVLTTTMSHRRGSAARFAGAGVPRVAAGADRGLGGRGHVGVGLLPPS